MSVGVGNTGVKGAHLASALRANYRLDESEDPARRGWRFDSAGFYRAWFRGPRSRPYFFLFKKNLTVTNLQFAELLALLRTYTQREGESGRPDLQFLSTTEFTQKVDELLVALTGEEISEEAIDRRCETFEARWGDLFARTVVLDAFYGSCVIFLPPGLDLDLASVCAMSGYIHSCGPSIWARKVKKADPEELVGKLEERVPGAEGLRTTFAVYSHEDFSEFDREEASELRHGLDEVKIWVDKYWIGNQRLTAVLKELNERVPRLEVAGAGDYRDVRSRLRDLEDMDRERCFWLIVDRAIGDDGVHAGSERYYLCYEQHYFNENPFHTFDENKPAWRSHTTLPHTLTGAMINLTVPYWTSRQPHLVDPFVGTGTTLLEAAKFPGLQLEGVDKDPMAPLLIDDNIEFFTRSAGELREMQSHLHAAVLVGEELVSGDDVEKMVGRDIWSRGGIADPEVGKLLLDFMWVEQMVSAYRRIEALLEPVAKDPDSEFTMSARQVDGLRSQWTLDERLLLYIGLRAVRRNVAARERGDERGEYRRAWLKEAKLLRRQIAHVAERYGRETIEVANGSVRVFAGFYSRECAALTTLLDRCHSDSGAVRSEDALDLGSERRFDLFVTDPPYGFNTDADSADLAALYTSIIKLALSSLRDGGQLVLALPDQSFIGRDPGFFANRKFIEQQVTALAHDMGRDLATSREVLPSTPPIYRAPYYWESDRALRRAIVHYRLAGKPADGRRGSRWASRPGWRQLFSR